MKHSPKARPAEPGPRVVRLNPDADIGLTNQQAAQRRAEGLSNTAPETLSKSIGAILRDNLVTFFNFVFVALALCLVAVGAYTDILFLGIVIVNVLIGVIQEIRVKRTLERITLLAARDVAVIRGGQRLEVPPEELVLDDIIEAAAGDQLCADAVLRSGFLEVDESLLTGESDPVPKGPGDMLLSGSVVMAGSGRAQLERVGRDCYASQITGAARKGRRRRSGMMRALDRWLQLTSFAIVPLGLILFWRAWSQPETDLRYAVSSTVAAVVGMIPEGLYLLVSAALAVSVIALSRRGTLVHELSCIENLARVDTLCLDKTGTITEGCMSVTSFIPALADEDELKGLLSAFVHAAGSGNSTSAALRQHCGAPPQAWEVRREVPFSSARKWSAIERADGMQYILGAPEAVLGSGLRPWRSALQKEWEQGRRVLALACGRDMIKDSTLCRTPEALGFVVLADRVRPAAHETLRYFYAQGVDIKIISGDSPEAAARLAGQAGVIGAERWLDVSGLSDDELRRQAADTVVFGRVSPQQKKEIIRALQQKGRSVAMLGDGVNDVLALREADCSVAMASGSDAAQQISQLVLLNSDFSVLPLIVREGRRVMGNIGRAASLFLVKNIYSFCMAAALLFLPLQYPLLPIQVSLYSGLMIGLPSFLLTFEPAADRVRGHFLYRAVLNALPGGLSVAAVLLTAAWWGERIGLPSEQIATLGTMLIGLGGVMVLLWLCWPLSRLRAALVAAMAVLYALAVIVLGPWILHTVPLGREAARMALCLLAALPVLFGVLACVCGFIKRKLTQKEE